VSHKDIATAGPTRSQAVLPREGFEILSNLGLNESDIVEFGWRSVPALSPFERRMSLANVIKNGGTDAYKIFESFLGDYTFKETLRIMDVANGCGIQCDTCLADVPPPTKIFTYGSLERLFSDPRFKKLLQPDSFRIGSAGDVSDHPRGLDIVNLVLRETKELDLKRQIDGKRHRVNVYTNYRPNREEFLDGLLQLAQRNKDRLIAVISLPVNRNDTVYRRFADFARARTHIFGENTETDSQGRYTASGEFNLPNLGLQDLYRQNYLFGQGRILSEDTMIEKAHEGRYRDPNEENVYRHRGYVKTFLNPDGLWLMVYTTPHESHTCRAFTLITPENISKLSHLNYHPDFPTPPNWPGKSGVLKYSQDARSLMYAREAVGLTPKQPIIISSGR